MPTLAEHPSHSIVRMLAIGDSGTGKTGSLAALVIAGYTLYILDYDNGLDILVAALRDHYKSDTAALSAAMSRVHYASLRDTIHMVNGVPKVKPPVTAWKGAGKAITEWNYAELGSRDVIVLDTLTTASHAAFNEALAVNARLNQRPQQSDYGWMADSVLLFIQALTDEDNKFNLIVNTHIRYFGADDETSTQARGLPNAKGQQIPKDIAKFFNTVVLYRTQGTGIAAKRVISTKPQGVIEVKTSNPFGLKDTYPVSNTGLADLFADILGQQPAA